jgi:adenylate kinase
MNQGKVLSDEIVTPLVREEIQHMGDNPEILLDGCPRTIGQATWLASAQETPLVRLVIHMVVDDETALRRLLSRGREDDTEDAMRVRFAGYHRDISAVLEEFRKKDIQIVEVNASLPEEEVFSQIYEAISK